MLFSCGGGSSSGGGGGLNIDEPLEINMPGLANFADEDEFGDDDVSFYSYAPEILNAAKLAKENGKSLKEYYVKRYRDGKCTGTNEQFECTAESKHKTGNMTFHTIIVTKDGMPIKSAVRITLSFVSEGMRGTTIESSYSQFLENDRYRTKSVISGGNGIFTSEGLLEAKLGELEKGTLKGFIKEEYMARSRVATYEGIIKSTEPKSDSEYDTTVTLSPGKTKKLPIIGEFSER